jgi:hypothetical protein
LDHVVARATLDGSRVLLGLDFAFAFPFCDRQAYFPSQRESAVSREILWAIVDKDCSGAPDLYGGPFYREPAARFREYLWYDPGNRGRRYEPRLRIAEDLCTLTNPTTCFKFFGANQVGPGSIAGMRFLHAMEHLRASGQVAVWPFDSYADAPVTIVEIFPRLFERLGIQARGRYKDEHERDALSSALALSELSRHQEYWHPAAMTEQARIYEGWILGVK